MSSRSAGRSSLHVEEGLVSQVLCPHCDAPLSRVSATLLEATSASVFSFGKRYVYACPACTKALGVSHRKGFWMG